MLVPAAASELRSASKFTVSSQQSGTKAVQIKVKDLISPFDCFLFLTLFRWCFFNICLDLQLCQVCQVYIFVVMKANILF